jgi:hypothetical protein
MLRRSQGRHQLNANGAADDADRLEVLKPFEQFILTVEPRNNSRTC